MSGHFFTKYDVQINPQRSLDRACTTEQGFRSFHVSVWCSTVAAVYLLVSLGAFGRRVRGSSKLLVSGLGMHSRSRMDWLLCDQVKSRLEPILVEFQGLIADQDYFKGAVYFVKKIQNHVHSSAFALAGRWAESVKQNVVASS